jgi:hypothetical protein
MSKKFKILNPCNEDHNWLAVQLTVEFATNGEWVDIQENIEAPLNQLSDDGARMVSVLHSMGITTRDLFDEWIKGYEALFQVKNLLFNTFKDAP